MPSIYNPNGTLIAHADWMKKTAGGVVSIRGKELETIDKFLLRFERATTAYGREWEANEVRIAFDNYVRTHPKWESSDRNKSRAFNDLNFGLGLLGLSQPLRAGQDPALAAHLRRGVLFFLSRLQSDLVPADWGNFINDSLEAGSDMHDLVQTGRAQGGVKSTASAVKGTVLSGTSGEKSSDGFLKSVVEAVQQYLAQIAGPVNGLLREAVAAIANALPELLKTILGAMLQNLGAAVDIVRNLAKAGKAAVATFSSRHLEDGVMSGHPRTVVSSVRQQIKDHGYDGVKEAVKTALITGVGVANPIAGTVVSAIAAVYKFVTELWARIKERVKLAGLIVEAGTHLGAQLHEDAAGFNKWFLKAIGDMPLLTCYCMCMPITGSYYGFLTLVSTNGTQMSYEQLERNYGEFNDVKTWARKFIKGGQVKLKSDDKLVAHSIAVANGKGESETKKTLATRVKKTFYSMVENAADA